MTLLLAVYGSLREGLALPWQPPGLGDLLLDRRPCRLAGRLVDLGAYPGLIDGGGPVVGEVCRVPDEAVAAFDAYEGSDYERRLVRLLAPDVEAWTYVWRRPWTASMLVEGGDWAVHLDRRLRAGQWPPDPAAGGGGGT